MFFQELAFFQFSLVHISAAAALIIDKEVSIASRVFYKNKAVLPPTTTQHILLTTHTGDTILLHFSRWQALPKVQVIAVSGSKSMVVE
jgi:hypothetical protein